MSAPPGAGSFKGEVTQSLYRIEQEARGMTAADRLALRRRHAQPLWDELHLWLRLERTRVADGGGIFDEGTLYASGEPILN